MTAGGINPDTNSCSGSSTDLGGFTTKYLSPEDPQRGPVQAGAPLTGSGDATTTGTMFNFPAAPSAVWEIGDGAPGPGFRQTTNGSFTGSGPYLYSYTYANLRNDSGSFGAGKGFFSTLAAPATLTFKNIAGSSTYATVTVKRGTNRFGGVMKLLGSYTTKVCYFYAGGCGLGYGTWDYEDIGAAGYKAGGVVTKSYTTSFSFSYFNTALGTLAYYDIVAQRFPWTTGTVTVKATGRGPNNTIEQRKGYDNRVDGMGTVQLVSPVLTQWLAQAPNAPKLETGGVAVLKIKFAPEPGVLSGLAAGLALLTVLRRFRS